jgi:hypothetical protein
VLPPAAALAFVLIRILLTAGLIERRHPFGGQTQRQHQLRNQGRHGRLVRIVLQGTAANPNSTSSQFGEPANTSSVLAHWMRHLASSPFLSRIPLISEHFLRSLHFVDLLVSSPSANVA